MKGDDWPIVGYVDRFSVAPGDNLRVMVSTDCDRYTAKVVRFGAAQPEPVAVPGTGTFQGRVQPIFTGSYVLVPASPTLEIESLGIEAWIYPTLPAAGRLQGVVTRMSRTSGWGLYLDEAGRLAFAVESGMYRCVKPLPARTWNRITCSYDTRNGSLRLTSQEMSQQQQIEGGLLPAKAWAAAQTPLLIGAGRWFEAPRPHAEQHFEGKIESPHLLAGGTLIGSWDFSVGFSSNEVSDTSPNRLQGTVINMPMRGVTGHAWRGAEQCFARAPEEYAAIHFHSDDLSDAGWEPDFELAIPANLPSGAYAVHLAAGQETDDIPFFVTPPPGSQQRIAFLAPTFTYLAYANEHFGSGTGTRPAGDAQLDPADLFVAQHPEVGRGLYDRHVEGSGCCYSTRLRPIVNMRPDYRSLRLGQPRNYSADLQLIRWLRRKGFDHDLVTDEALNAQGVAALSGYQVVVTGSHPEYCSAHMLDALQAYLQGGGKLMYLGGNGFYWVTSATEHLIEVRRGLAGTRTWSSEPGELYHSTTGEMGGLWRHRGRPPNHLVGVGFSAMGDGGTGYRRLEGSHRADVAFIFEGVGADEVIGDFGAAGDEVDRIDFALGSPSNTVVLASATELNDTYAPAIEEIVVEDAEMSPRMRADLVYFDVSGGGAVFSVGSINWIASLGHNRDQNSISRITENVLTRFLG